MKANTPNTPNTKDMIKTAAMTLVFVIALHMSADMMDKSSAAIPDCVGYISGGYGKMTFSEISEVQKNESCPGDIKINAQSISPGYASSERGIFANVEIVATDENYTEFHSIDITKGAFGGTGALISENLANTLFMSIDIVGAAFYLFDSEIAVAGVYRPDSSFLAEISSDGKECVIVPHALNPTQNDTVGLLYIKSKTGGGPGAFDEMELNRLLGGKLDNYTKTDLSEHKKVISQFKAIMFFLVGAAFFAAMLGGFLKLVFALANKGDAKNTVFYVKLAALGAALIALPLVVSFELYIPAGFFPADKNILSLAHYIDLFVGFVRRQNTGAYYFYGSLYFWSVLCILPLSTANVLMAAKVALKCGDFV